MTKLKTKITKKFMLVGSVSILLTFLSLVIAFWFFLSGEIKSDLSVYANSLSTVAESTNIETLKQMANKAYRITVINKDGSVIFESDHDTSVKNMDNHLDRPEVKEAISNGTGQNERISKTLGVVTYYYAVRLDNGNVFRVAREASTVISVFYSFSPIIIIVLIYVILICLVMSSEFTKRIVRPIENMAEDIDNINYEELVPFAATIKNQQEKINQQMEKVLEIDKIKQDFTANVSHELKTPLTSISGYAEMIQTGMAKAEDTKEFARKIHREAGRLVTLIEDILELSKLDGSEFVKNISKINLLSLANECAEDLKINADKHNVALVVSGENAVINGDRKLLYELVYNLCDNAIRYNKENGKVYITVKNSLHGINLVVEDTGIGIPQEHQSRIFERFYRVDKSRSKNTGGTGLGLAIVKHIAEQHNAKITLESTLGVGTKITVNF